MNPGVVVSTVIQGHHTVGNAVGPGDGNKVGITGLNVGLGVGKFEGIELGEGLGISDGLKVGI